MESGGQRNRRLAAPSRPWRSSISSAAKNAAVARAVAGSANTDVASVSKPALVSVRRSMSHAARPMGACLSRASRVARSVAAAA